MPVTLYGLSPNASNTYPQYFIVFIRNFVSFFFLKHSSHILFIDTRHVSMPTLMEFSHITDFHHYACHSFSVFVSGRYTIIPNIKLSVHNKKLSCSFVSKTEKVKRIRPDGVICPINWEKYISNVFNIHCSFRIIIFPCSSCC